MQKELIKKRFAKSLSTYNDNAIVQKKMAEKLANIIDKIYYDNILELGCGTGFLTNEIIKKCDFNSYYAIDIVNGCENYIEQISKDVIFEEFDIEKYIPKIAPNLVVSNASFQWINDLKTFINEFIYDYLSNNGEVIFTLFGKENYKEFKPFMASSLQYYGIDEIKELFHKYDIEFIKEHIEILEFKTPLDVLYHIKRTGVNSLEQANWTKSDLNYFIKEYPKLHNSKNILTYNPIYIKLKK